MKDLIIKWIGWQLVVIGFVAGMSGLDTNDAERPALDCSTFVNGAGNIIINVAVPLINFLPDFESRCEQ